MNAKQFLDEFGRHELKRVAILAGSNYQYAWQLARGYRKASPGLAERLEAASGGRMDRIALVWPEWSGDEGSHGIPDTHDSSGK